MTRDVYDAHPSFGLSRSTRAGAHPRDLATLPMSWLRLSREFRREREQEFFTTLLTVLSEREGASFCVPARAGSADGSRPLTREAARDVAQTAPESLAVWDAYGPLAEVVADWTGVAVWLSPDEAEAARRELEVTDVRAAPEPEGAVRAVLLRATHVLLYVLCIAPGIAIGKFFVDGAVRYVVALAIIVVSILLSIPLTRWIERNY